MKTIHDQLAAIQRHGASHFGETSLADSHRPVTRRVRRDRAVRGSVATLAGVGVVGAGTFGVLQLRGADALAPAGVTSPTGTGTEDTSEVAVDGEVPVGREVIFTVEPGERLDAVIKRLAEAYEAPVDNAAAAIDSQLPPEAGGNPEGWLAAAEYGIGIEPDATADETIADHAELMVNTTVAVLEINDVPRDQWQQVITIASLVERESARAEDMSQIARVILNRVEADMRLELDSTIRYALGDAATEGPFTSANERSVDSDYNTYMHPGLPPGPIGMPSPEAVKAVVNPAGGDWLYFVTVNPDTGETRFATTFEEHLEDVAVLQEWAQENN